MSTAELDPISRACRLLREGAAELKNCHTLAATGHDWTGEPEAKAAYDESMAAADALERVHAECKTLRTGYAAARLEIESLRAALATPQQEAQEPVADALDAARYRWLRDNATRAGVNIDIGAGVEISETLDEAIDAARAAQEGKNHD